MKKEKIIFQSLGTKNQDPPECLGGQSWFRILGAPKIRIFFVVFFWNPGTKIASQDFLGDLGSWFPGSKKIKIKNQFFNFSDPGNQEPRSPTKSWGAILVPDLGGSKKLEKLLLLFFWNPGTKIDSQDFLGDLGSWFPGSKKLKIIFSIFQSLGTKNQDPPESLGGQSWFRILGAPNFV